MTDHPLHQLAMQIRYDLTAAQSKLTELVRQIAEAGLPTPTELRCPTCGIHARGKLTLAEHLHVSHDGPVPDHWLHAEAISAPPVEESVSRVRARNPQPHDEGTRT